MKLLRKNMRLLILTLVSAALLTTNASAGTIVVGSLAAAPGNGVWGTFFGSTPGGTASIQDLSGIGGNLEINQPLGPSAVRLTTGGNTAERAQIGILGSFGNAAAILNNLTAGYSFYKDGTVAGTNTAAAPSLKLTVFNSATHGISGNDSFGELIYEPYWNQIGTGPQDPPANSWQTISIDSNTGSGSTAAGGWWWTGGFGQASGAGGPPIRSAAEWASLFNADFANAQIVGISVGVGTFNLNQVGYVDRVILGDTTYDFGAAAVPEPTSVAIFGLMGLAAIGIRHRRKRSA